MAPKEEARLHCVIALPRSCRAEEHSLNHISHYLGCKHGFISYASQQS